MASEEVATVCADADQEAAAAAAAAAAMKEEGGRGKRRRRRQPRKGEEEGGRKKYALVSYHELPEYMKENEFILNYYRSEWPVLNAVLSLFSWHNETINVWTYVRPGPSRRFFFVPVRAWFPAC
jgi:adiponectin receptor